MLSAKNTVVFLCLFVLAVANGARAGYLLPANQWRMISLPAAPPPGQNTLRDVFADDIGLAESDYGSKWALFSYNAQLNRYEMPGLRSPLFQGRGYWIIQLTGHAVTLELPDGSRASPRDFQLDLVPAADRISWNLVGNPFATPVQVEGIRAIASGTACPAPGCDLDTAAAENLVHNRLYHYDGQHYVVKDTSASLQAWDGFWIAALENSRGHSLGLAFTLSEGGGSPPVVTREQAAAFLARATFGATNEDIDALLAKGSYEAWLEEQFTTPPSYHLAWAEVNIEGINNTASPRDNPEDWKRYADTLGELQKDVWWQVATRAADQLRQRVALALSEILVISKNNGVLLTQPDSRITYYDVLVKNALGNFETLLQEVTYHPAMGIYLSYVGNVKGDPARGSHPDENYAREVMQLFTIGLYRLNPDGSRQLDATGNPIPTYSQEDVREMARVFTGLDYNYDRETGTDDSFRARTRPMIAIEENHDTGEKHLLGGTVVLPAGGTTKGDIDQALHALFMHPNTGPFIARRLIQRLVTSNPSPGYIQRVAAAFNDNGHGVRGDLKEVVKAILLDDEALHGRETMPDQFGKFREPLLYITNLLRAFHAQDKLVIYQLYTGGPTYRLRRYPFQGTGDLIQGAPLEALTVFNYFTPDDGPFRLKKEDNLVAPEITIYGKQAIDGLLMNILRKNLDGPTPQAVGLDLTRETDLAAAGDYHGLLDELDTLLTGGRMTDASKQAIIDYLREHAQQADEDGGPFPPEKLASCAIGLVMTSPDYALQQ